MASNYTETIIVQEVLVSTCQRMSLTPSMNSNTHIQKDPNMHYTNRNAQTMEKGTMVQIGKSIRDPNRTEKKTNPKIGGNISILFMVSRPNITSFTWINYSISRKRNNTNRNCSTPVLDYFVNHYNEKLRYHAIYMILRIYSDTYYLSELKVSIRAVGHFFMGCQNFKNTKTALYTQYQT